MTDDPTPDRDAPTMKHVSHTHPYDGSHASTRLFSRGPRVEADGGSSRGTPALSENGTAVPERRLPAPTMADVSHTPPYGADVNRVWQRGPPGDHE
jgi:hypothetical protein